MTDDAPLTYEGTELVATLNKGVMAFGFWVSLVASGIGGLYFFFEYGGRLYDKSNFSFFIFVFGGVIAPFFYYALKNNQPELIINKNGIWERSSGLTCWEDIRSFTIAHIIDKHKVINGRYLVLQDHTLQERNIRISQLSVSEDVIVKAILHYTKSYEIFDCGKKTIENF